LTNKHGDKSPQIPVSDRWVNREQAVFGWLWYEFLHLSPSYELAHRERTGTLSDTDRARLPADFEAVLSVYDNLGNLHRISFDDWWAAKGIRHFGYQGEHPSVHVMEALLKETDEPLAHLTAKAGEYINGRWADQGRQTCLIVSIPVGLPKKLVLDHIADILSRTTEEHRQIVLTPPTYKVLPRKKDSDSLFRYLQCLWNRSYYPKAKLYEIGVIAELSTTYSLRLAKYEGGVEDRHALKILTSRALNRGIMIAENAARGVFPTYAKCEHCVRPDWEELGRTLNSRIDWENSTDC